VGRIDRGGGNGGEPALAHPKTVMVFANMCAGRSLRPAHYCRIRQPAPARGFIGQFGITMLRRFITRIVPQAFRNRETVVLPPAHREIVKMFARVTPAVPGIGHPAFELIELWIENRVMIEIATPDMLANYVRSATALAHDEALSRMASAWVAAVGQTAPA